MTDFSSPPFEPDACDKWSVLPHVLSACCVGNTSWQIWMMQPLLKYSTFSYVPQILVKHYSNCESPCIWIEMRCAALKEANTPISLLFVLQYLLTDMTFCCISHILVRHSSSSESPSIHHTWDSTLWFISMFCCVVQPTVLCVINRCFDAKIFGYWMPRIMSPNTIIYVLYGMSRFNAPRFFGFNTSPESLFKWWVSQCVHMWNFQTQTL